MPRLFKHTYHKWKHPATVPLRVPPQFLNILMAVVVLLDVGAITLEDLEKFLGLDNLADKGNNLDNLKKAEDL